MREVSVLSAVLGAMRSKAAPRNLNGVNDNRGWTSLGWIGGRSPYAFDRGDIEVNHDAVMAQATVYACISLISSDIGKLRLKLVQFADGIWQETESPSFSPVLRKPNRYQTRQKFIEQWIISKLTNGNTYVLKERDRRGVVTELHVLDPQRVRPLVASNGWVYYELMPDNLAQVPDGERVVAPADEIIHDTMACLFHPLIGVSPIFACGLAATQALKIQRNSALFFENGSRPGGMLTAPGAITEEQAARLKSHWETNFGGGNIGRVAVLGDGLKYEAMTVNPVDAQLVAQLELSSKQVCSTFHVPGYMVGAEAVPPNNNVQMLSLQYYSQCLQALIESLEACLDDGLGLLNSAVKYGTEFELEDLLRMDTSSQVEALNKAVSGGWMAPNEARAKRNLPKVTGGDSPMMQQQQFSLEALSERDQDKPFSKPAEPAPATSAAKRWIKSNDAGEAESDELEKAASYALWKCLQEMKREG